MAFRLRTAADDRELSGSNDMRFLIRKNGVLYKTRKMFQKKTFQNFSSSTHLGIKETIEFQFIAEFTTAKMFLVISLATFPTQFAREIILPQTLASLHTWYSEGCVESKRKDKSSDRDRILVSVADMTHLEVSITVPSQVIT